MVLIGGIFFSVIGMVALGYGKREKSVRIMVTAGVLMVFPYFVTNVYALYGIGAALTAYLFVGGGS